MILTPKYRKMLNSLDDASLRVIRAVIHMIEQGQQEEVDAFLKALQAVQ